MNDKDIKEVSENLLLLLAISLYELMEHLEKVKKER